MTSKGAKGFRAAREPITRRSIYNQMKKPSPLDLQQYYNVTTDRFFEGLETKRSSEISDMLSRLHNHRMSIQADYDSQGRNPHLVIDTLTLPTDPRNTNVTHTAELINDILPYKQYPSVTETESMATQQLNDKYQKSMETRGNYSIAEHDTTQASQHHYQNTKYDNHDLKKVPLLKSLKHVQFKQKPNNKNDEFFDQILYKNNRKPGFNPFPSKGKARLDEFNKSKYNIASNRSRHRDELQNDKILLDQVNMKRQLQQKQSNNQIESQTSSQMRITGGGSQVQQSGSQTVHSSPRKNSIIETRKILRNNGWANTQKNRMKMNQINYSQYSQRRGSQPIIDMINYKSSQLESTQKLGEVGRRSIDYQVHDSPRLPQLSQASKTVSRPNRIYHNNFRSVDFNKTPYQRPIVARQFLANIQDQVKEESYLHRFITTKDIEQKWQKQLQTSLRINSITQQLEDNLLTQSNAVQANLSPEDDQRIVQENRDLQNVQSKQFRNSFNNQLSEIMQSNRMSSSPPMFNLNNKPSVIRYLPEDPDGQLTTEQKKLEFDPQEDDSNYMSSPISPELQDKFLKQGSFDRSKEEINDFISSAGIKIVRLDQAIEDINTAGFDDPSMLSPSNV